MKHSVHHYYQAIRALRAGTGGNSRVSQYIMQHALDNNLFVTEDDHMNTYLEKPASPGREQEPVILIHGGSDLAAAVIVALTEDCQSSLPALEITYACDEEFAYKKTAKERRQLRAGYIIGLDKEISNDVAAFCAGGVRLDFETQIIREKPRAGFIPAEITISGLQGGYSAQDVFHGRGNAIKMMGEFLFNWYNYSFDSRLVSIEGGERFNCIATTCKARLLIPEHQKEDLNRGVWWFGEDIPRKFGSAEPNARIQVTYPENVDISTWTPMCSDASGRILSFLNISPNGIINMDPEEADMVETGSNMGIVSSSVDDWKLSISIRSFSDENKEMVRSRFELFADMNRIDHAAVGSFPSLIELELSDIPQGEEIDRESARKLYEELIRLITGTEIE